jgi:hypothetical protein
MQGNFPMPDILFMENGITKLLANLNPHKAAGPDNIMPRVLKERAIEISPILTLIFNKSYQSDLGCLLFLLIVNGALHWHWT